MGTAGRGNGTPALTRPAQLHDRRRLSMPPDNSGSIVAGTHDSVSRTLAGTEAASYGSAIVAPPLYRHTALTATTYVTNTGLLVSTHRQVRKRIKLADNEAAILKASAAAACLPPAGW